MSLVARVAGKDGTHAIEVESEATVSDLLQAAASSLGLEGPLNVIQHGEVLPKNALLSDIGVVSESVVEVRPITDEFELLFGILESPQEREELFGYSDYATFHANNESTAGKAQFIRNRARHGCQWADGFWSTVGLNAQNRISTFCLDTRVSSLNLDALVWLRSLKQLGLREVGISGTIKLKMFPRSLQTLRLQKNSITRVEFGIGEFGGDVLPELKELLLWGNQIASISAVARSMSLSVPKLERLSLADNPLSDVSLMWLLSSFPGGLRHFNGRRCGWTGTVRLSRLAGFPSDCVVDVQGNRLSLEGPPPFGYQVISVRQGDDDFKHFRLAPQERINEWPIAPISKDVQSAEIRDSEDGE